MCNNTMYLKCVELGVETPPQPTECFKTCFKRIKHLEPPTLQIQGTSIDDYTTINPFLLKPSIKGINCE